MPFHRPRAMGLALTLVSLFAAFPASPAAHAFDMRPPFVSPPDNARPWVYWYFMDGNQSREGMHADLEAMKRAGIGGAIILDVDIGIPRGPVEFMGPQWQSDFVYAVSEAKRLGLQIALGAGPGWCGAGGPWITPELSMQHLVSSETKVSGPIHFDGALPRPQPRRPFFGEDTLSESLKKKWKDYYKDEYVIAFPTPAGDARIGGVDDKALYYRSSYSSFGAAPRIPSPITGATVPTDQCIPAGKIVDLTGKMSPDGHLNWDAPAGNWTVMRFGRTSTGQTTRPAPQAGLGFESDKFTTAALDKQFQSFEDVLLNQIAPDYHAGGTGLTTLHFDSWEVSSQNWSEQFRQEFIKRCGYDPLPYLPAMSGYVVGSPEISERFLWDLRHAASDLLIESHGRYMAQYAHKHGLAFSVEPYDLNPSADLDLGSVADLPMGEFWSKKWGIDSSYSVIEATSIGHTNGKKVIGAESFTASSNENWQQYPGSMKEQLDWAICAGINKFVIHRYQHQPDVNSFPGMTMGPYGVHWERTQTWWDMVNAFHLYATRCSWMLRQGLPVADILYLTPEGAPEVFTPPSTAFQVNGGLADRRGYNFDGCSPENLIEHAKVRRGRIVLPDGMSYRMLVLPQWNSMTPALLRKITKLVKDGATVTGAPPVKSPSLTNYPASDKEVRTLVKELWGPAPYAPVHKLGTGRIVLDTLQPSTNLDQARWIWFAEGQPAQSAPVGKRWFRKSIQIDAGRKVVSALAVVDADNTFDLSVNGYEVGTGDNFHNPQTFDITKYLKPGANEVDVEAANGDNSPNPAGMIASLKVTYSGGASASFDTDKTWEAAQSKDGPWSAAMDLGPSGMGPWSLSALTPPLYQTYSKTVELLSGMGVSPDFSSTAPMRYIHRSVGSAEVYFISNATDSPIDSTCAFRVAGQQPEWWNPVTAETRDLPNYAVKNGITTLPVHLAPYESGFVVFRKPAGKGNGTAVNFPEYRSLITLDHPWSVQFDPKWGGPARMTFTTLDDWSKRPEDGIKHYSGKAVYTTSFDGPARILANRTYALSLGTVKNLASVKLNGHDLGVIWCDPWRVTIPAEYLKSNGNQLEITVANLWSNRLIGDAGKPETQRLSHTTYSEYNADSPLEPSGLLGPVTLEYAEESVP